MKSFEKWKKETEEFWVGEGGAPFSKMIDRWLMKKYADGYSGQDIYDLFVALEKPEMLGCLYTLYRICHGSEFGMNRCIDFLHTQWAEGGYDTADLAINWMTKVIDEACEADEKAEEEGGDEDKQNVLKSPAGALT